MKRAIAILPFGLILALAACNRNVGPMAPDFGNATEYNMSVQIINPEPATAGYGAPALDGIRAKGAVDRYKGGSVITPTAESTGGGS